MTGKIIDRGTAGFLVLIIPLAVGIVLLFTAWPFILLFVLLTVAVKVWQDYRWSKLSTVVNPYFNQLLQEYQGCLTPIDLATKTNLPARTARQFLERKADEFGALKKTVGEKGTVYYFITASTLGSILDDSEPVAEETEMIEPPKAEVAAIPPTSRPTVPPVPPATGLGKLLDEVEEPAPPAPVTNLGKLLDEVEETAPEPVPASPPVEASKPAREPMVLSDLAKRLGVTPAALGKRKNSPEFADWSRSKDPDGVAWQYLPEETMFAAIEE
ncbi:hypothetical protein V0288_24060 [Pannus brasiliensis CCIBt3594]|uniref:Uncharacterized protein n=1 Tax=Pannus brasiliensis CCIBt3594 TaxID=1427578 RepID=A0AAW9QY44_9CHRO